MVIGESLTDPARKRCYNALRSGRVSMRTTMKKICFAVLTGIIAAATANAQYTQPDNFKSSIEDVFPTQVFDSVAARNALARGTATLNGVLVTRKTGVGDGFKTIYLFPATPYFKEWYDLKRKGVRVSRGIIKVAAMDSIAARYGYWCKANIEGEFSFPNLRPGKYILLVTVNRATVCTYDRYQGSGYNNYGGQTDYYSRERYSTSFKEDLVKEVEIPANEQTVYIKWKK